MLTEQDRAKGVSVRNIQRDRNRRERKRNQIGLMPPKKQLKQRKKKSGSQWRMALDFGKLREAGGTIKRDEGESSSKGKVYFRYTNPGGKTLKSAKDVERQLKSEGIYERFTNQDADEAPEICQRTDARPRESYSSDPDYEPDVIHKGKGGEMVNFFHMTLVAIGGFHVTS